MMALQPVLIDWSKRALDSSFQGLAHRAREEMAACFGVPRDSLSKLVITFLGLGLYTEILSFSVARP